MRLLPVVLMFFWGACSPEELPTDTVRLLSMGLDGHAPALRAFNNQLASDMSGPFAYSACLPVLAEGLYANDMSTRHQATWVYFDIAWRIHDERVFAPLGLEDAWLAYERDTGAEAAFRRLFPQVVLNAGTTPRSADGDLLWRRLYWTVSGFENPTEVELGAVESVFLSAMSNPDERVRKQAGEAFASLQALRGQVHSERIGESDSHFAWPVCR